MKKASLFLASIGAFVVLMPAIASAAPTPAPATKTKIQGVITNNNKPVKNADVTVICKNIARYAKTDKNGAYEVTYNKDKCPIGSTVNVTATKNKLGGVGSGTVKSDTAEVNLSIVNVSVPEFGVATGFLAAGIGGAAFLYIRNRQTGAVAA